MSLFSLGPAVNIFLQIISYSNNLKMKIIKREHTKGIGCPLLNSIYTGQETEKREKMIRLEPKLEFILMHV